MQLLLSRRVDPRSGVSLMWGRVQAGSVANAIPSTGEIEGTLRALDVAGWQQAKELVPQLLRRGGPAVRRPGPGRRSTTACRRRSTTSAASGGSPAPPRRCSGPHGVTTTEQSLGGEDFSWMLQQVPGALARLGVRPPGASSTPDIHQPNFVADERCIPVGLRVLADVASVRGAPRHLKRRTVTGDGLRCQAARFA